MPLSHRQQSWLQTILVLMLVAMAAWHLRIDLSDLGLGFRNLIGLAGDAFPPQMDLLPTAVQAAAETLAIALLGTFFGTLLALPLGFAGARTLVPLRVFVPARLLSAAIRTMPSLLWAVLFVVLVGFKPLAGVLAMSMYTVGHLAKLQYESLEGLSPQALEAARATGAGFLPVARHVVLPEAANALRSQILYMFEYNVRASAIVGFVGAGGIGFYIQRYLQMMQYDGVVTLLAVVFVMIVAVDGLSLWVRRRYLGLLPGEN